VARTLVLPALAIAAIAATLTPSVLAAPEPALIPVRWQLDVEAGPLRMATVDVEIEVPGPNGTVALVRQPRAYFYFVYKVVNKTGQDLTFAPSFEMATDDGDLFKAGRNVPLEVTGTLLQRLRNSFLQDQVSIIGTLGQGEENAKEGLVVWEAPNLKVDEITIFASGFSGESRRITKPGSGEEVVLRKTLMLRHLAPGDISVFDDQVIPRTEERWILR
jgi:hypothetical protein